MGKVYKARAPDGQIVAVKVLAAHLTDNEIQRSRFYQEARLAMQVDHPNMVRAIAVGESDNHHYIAMEFVEGELLRRRIKREGPIPEKEARRIIGQVALALHKAHKLGLVHRDVKPDNVLVSSSGLAKLTDLGLAKALDEDLNLTKTGRGLGTPHYMAPEQFKDAKHADARADIYSLGATLYMLVTGAVPFAAASPLDTFIKKSKNEYVPPRQLNPNLSEATARAIERAMEADPALRPPTAKAFAEMLLGKDSLGDTALPPPAAGEQVWFIIAPQADGKPKKIKGPRSSIEAQIVKGKLGILAQASPSRDGPFRPIDQIPEFRDALRKRSPMETTEEMSFIRREPSASAVPTSRPDRGWLDRLRDMAREWLQPSYLFLAAGTLFLILVMAWLFWQI